MSVGGLGIWHDWRLAKSSNAKHEATEIRCQQQRYGSLLSLVSIEERIPASPHRWAFPCIWRNQAAAATSEQFGEIAQELVIKDAIPQKG